MEEVDPRFGAPPSGFEPQGWVPPVAPSSPAGTLSPDGRHLWNGTHWVPTSTVPSPWSGSPPVLARPQQHAPFRDASARTWVAVAGLAATGLGAVLVLVAALGRLDLVDRVSKGGVVSVAEGANSDDLVTGSSGLEVALALFAAVALWIWLHRVVANNHALSRWSLRYTPGWAVGWWFVPVASLVMVPLVMAETWRATAVHRDALSARLTTAVLVGAWWLSGIAAVVLARSAQTSEVSDAGEDVSAELQALHDATVLRVWAAGMTVVVALLGVVLVWGTWRRQSRLAAQASGLDAARRAAAGVAT